MMNLRDLQYLESVFRLRHFGHAAEECHVSQPTLSMQLKKLEDELGAKLFERTNKAVLPTPAGRAIAEKARGILDEAAAIKTLARHFADPFSGTFSMGAFPTLAPFLFPRLMPGLNRLFPKLKLYLIEETSENLMESLVSGLIDMAFLALPVDDSRLCQAIVLTEPFHLALSKNHPLAKKKSVAMRDLKDEPVLLLQKGHCLAGQALDVCELSGAKASTHFRATSIETLRQMVASGLGVTLIPESAASIQAENLVYVPFEEPAPSRTVALFWRKASPFQEVFERLALEAKSVFKIVR